MLFDELLVLHHHHRHVDGAKLLAEDDFFYLGLRRQRRAAKRKGDGSRSGLAFQAKKTYHAARKTANVRSATRPFDCDKRRSALGGDTATTPGDVLLVFNGVPWWSGRYLVAARKPPST